MNIDFTPPPTGRKFMQSDAAMRVIMGPVGCLPADTEFLTPQGWKRMDAYTPGDLVAVWDRATGLVDFEAAEYVNLFAEEDFYRFANKGFCMELSPEHTVVYVDWRGQWQTKTAREFARRPSANHIPTTFSLRRADAAMSDHEIRMRMMFSADGHIPAMGKKVAVTVRKPRKVERLEMLLRDVAYARYHADRGGADEWVFRFVWPYGAADKSLQFLYTLSSRQLEVALDEMDHWDGLHDHEEKRFHTTVWENACAVQYAAHATGLRATIRTEVYDNPRWKPLHRVYITRPGSRKGCVRIRKDMSSITRVPADDGRKYCFTTTTGYFVARCEGNIFITGNSGKSVLSCFEIVRRATMQAPDTNGTRKTRCIVVRETARQLQDTTIKTWLDWFPDGVCGRYMKTIKTFFFRVGDVECEILFRALDDADDVANLNSLEATFAWINEAKDIHPDIFDALSKRVGRFPSMKDGGPTWFGIWCDTNPPVMGSWVYHQMEHLDPDDGVSPNDNGWEVFKQPSGRSPFAENIENLPEGYYDTTGRSADYIRVYIDGEYGLSAGGQPVFAYFRADYHVARTELRPIVNGHTPLVVGMDLGLTPAAVIGQLDARGRALVYGECVSFGMGVQRFVRTLLKPLLFERFSGAPIIIVVDPAGVQRAQTDERSAVDIIRAEGLKVMPARTNAISARIAAVDGYIMRQVDGDPALLIDPRCTRLRAALMGGYRYKKKDPGEIDKNDHSHCFPAGTLVSTPVGDRDIAAIMVGDMVTTPYGDMEVTATMERSADEWVEITIEDGRRITCTPEHPIYTTKGLLRADAIQYSSVLLTHGERQCPSRNTPSRSSKASSITASQVDITSLTSTGTEDSICTASCGNITTEPFLRGWLYTTRTMTGRITRSVTLKYCQLQTMLGSIWRNVCRITRAGTSPGWKRPGLQQPYRKESSRGLPKAGNISAKNPCSRGWAENMFNTPVCVAVSCSNGLEVRINGDIAAPHVEQPRELPAELTTKVGSASYVEGVSELIGTGRLKHAPRVVGVRCYRSRKKHRVYDITVRDAHCFYVHGLLVSNCADALQYLCLHLGSVQGSMLREHREVKRVAAVGWT